MREFVYAEDVEIVIGKSEARRRARIFRRDGMRCMYCGFTGAAEELTIDHVQPRVKGGDASDGNLVTCCRRCNQRKGGEAAWSFLARNPDLRSHFLAHATGIWPRLRRAIAEAAPG